MVKDFELLTQTSNSFVSKASPGVSFVKHDSSYDLGSNTAKRAHESIDGTTMSVQNETLNLSSSIDGDRDAGTFIDIKPSKNVSNFRSGE